jgi:PEP-CTERM motif
MRNRNGRYLAVLVAAISGSAAFGQLSKVDTLLQQEGFQLQAAVETGAPFYYDGHVNGSNQFVPGLTQANYTAPSWAGSASFEDSNGMALNGPWAIWNVNLGGSGNNFPDQVAADVPHLGNLVSMAIDDEVNWESDPSVEANLVSQFQYAESNSSYNHTILYTNNFIGQTQLDGTGVSNFIQQAHPDMLTFDGYPFLTSNATAATDSDILNTPFDSWYTEMRFYRDVTLDNSYQSSNPTYSVDWGLYRQIYSTDDGTRTPNGTEYAVQTFTAMAFGAKYESDFIYNGNASQLFTNQNEDATTALYAAVQHINQEATNLGRTMVYLTPLIANPNLNWTAGTPDILFLRGQDLTGNSSAPTTPTTLPNGFQPNTVNGSLESSWTSGANDPWMTGFGHTNVGHVIGQYTNPTTGATAYTTGDALISWFRPLGETQAQATAAGDIYFMIVNAFSTPTAAPGDCLQNINMDFTTWPLAPGQTQPSIQYVDPVTGQIITLNIDTALDGQITGTSIYPAGTVLLTKTSANGTGKLRLNVFLDGGDAFLFKFYTGDAFLVPEPSTLSLLGIGALRLLRRKRKPLAV